MTLSQNNYISQRDFLIKTALCYIIILTKKHWGRLVSTGVAGIKAAGRAFRLVNPDTNYKRQKRLRLRSLIKPAHPPRLCPRVGIRVS
jgi:hypothetical protein